ncbi:MAG: alpha/beta fold hydrolase [Phaeospirillum sp.]|nr:alpha/beta fold hydrolase [Phaeospirillum sp.]
MRKPPSDLAEGASRLLVIAGQLTEQIITLPAAASEKAAVLLRAMASKPEQAPQREPDSKVKLASPFIGSVEPQDIVAVLTELNSHLLDKPHVVLEETARYFRDMGQIMAGKMSLAPAKGDRRFSDNAWSDSPFHRMALHGYLSWSTALNRIIDRAGADTATTERMRYVSSLFTDALSPDNTLIGNPMALKAAVETAGGSLLDGMRNLLRDLGEKNTTPAQVDKGAFRVGGNLAATPGAVVFQNEVLELIQYAPVTAEVFSIPIMMVPPVVNKFYMMDMAPDRSLVQHLVEKGFQPFMISWRNPKPEHRHWGLNTYVSAMLEAIAAMRDITGSPTVNVFTICTGAVPLAALLGYMAAKKIDGVNSATTVVSIIDSNEGRSLGLFATPKTIRAAKRRSEAKGILTGEEMAKVFTWMRPRDLVWNYWINNYLLGKQPPALDILYWNNDPTRLTARMHAQLLDVYYEDLLRTPGGISIFETPIDLSKVTCDSYVVGGITDHISIWSGVYRSAQLYGGKFEFVLHSSGHVQSVITPPGTPKARYFVNPKTPKDPEEWIAKAEARPDSWWDHWCEWLIRHSAEKRPAPVQPGSDRFPAGAKAPGAYVMET